MLLKMMALQAEATKSCSSATMLGHAMLLTLRGVPTIYSGDEQGFVGDGGDQDARQDMFASKVAIYNDDKLLGTTATTAQSNFDTQASAVPRDREAGAHPRRPIRASTRGRQVVRFASEKPGLFAVSRFDPASGREMLLAVQHIDQPIEQNVRVETRSTRFHDARRRLSRPRLRHPAAVRIALPPLGYAVCDAR